MTCPSAGGIQPMRLFVIVNSIEGIKNSGIYYYDPLEKSITLIKKGDFLKDKCVSFQIVINTVYSKCKVKYKKRSVRYCNIEAGEMMQNASLQCESLGVKCYCDCDFKTKKYVDLLSLDEKKMKKFMYSDFIRKYENYRGKKRKVLEWKCVPLVVISIGVNNKNQ